MLGSDVLADLNTTLAPGSVSRDKLSADILADLNRTVTKSMLGPMSRRPQPHVTPQMIQSSSSPPPS